jgi:hypothetical protein
MRAGGCDWPLGEKASAAKMRPVVDPGGHMVRRTLTTEEWREAADKGSKTGRMANTLAKALARRYAKRWRFIDFRGDKTRRVCWNR